MNVSLPPASGPTPEQLNLLWRSCAQSAADDTPERACQRLADCISEISGVPAMVFRRRHSPWKLVVSSGVPGPIALPHPDALEGLGTTGPKIDAVKGAPNWASVRIPGDRSGYWILLVPAEWKDLEWLPRFAETVALALKIPTNRRVVQRAEDLAAVGYAVARRLGQLHDADELHQSVLESAARIVRAQRASLIRYEPREERLAVVATVGHPLEHVQHHRIDPGVGIVGSVFATGKPVLVRNVERMPWTANPDRAYSTGSFMAIPLMAGADTLGVITLADRADGTPFDEADIAAVRLVAAPAALAMSRQRLTEQVRELAHLSAVDPLTGLFNRRYLQRRLTAELERSRRSGSELAVMMVDVDHFKTINDRLGHAVGDLVLSQVADVLRRAVRLSDVCIRYGGDEFAVLVTESRETALQSAERIRQRVDAISWRGVSSAGDIDVTVSIGVAATEPGDTGDDVLLRADRFLYQAKASGRNCVRPEE